MSAADCVAVLEAWLKERREEATLFGSSALSLARDEALDAAIRALRHGGGEAADDLLKLQRFADRIMGDEGVSDVDGGEIQDAAEACGLLRPVVATEPCGDLCQCVEYGAFPHDCYRRTPTYMRAMKAAATPAPASKEPK